MTDIDDVLEQCLTDILTGDSTLDECLARYPEYFEQLEPLLRTALRVDIGSRVYPAPAFRVRARNTLISHMQAHPRKTTEAVSPFPFRRLMAGAISILLTLFVTGTVYAQGVLPGDPFYEWKLNSERAWRMVSSDSVVTDLRIANRRINEMNVTVHDQARWARALKGYNEVRLRLEVEVDSDTLDTILPSADLFSYPDAVTATPVEITEPLGTDTVVSASETSKSEDTLTPENPSATASEDNENAQDQADKENKKNDKNHEKGKDKEKENGQNETATAEPQEPQDVVPTPTAPVIIPTIEIPPPVQ